MQCNTAKMCLLASAIIVTTATTKTATTKTAITTIAKLVPATTTIII